MKSQDQGLALGVQGVFLTLKVQRKTMISGLIHCEDIFRDEETEPFWNSKLAGENCLVVVVTWNARCVSDVSLVSVLTLWPWAEVA